MIIPGVLLAGMLWPPILCFADDRSPIDSVLDTWSNIGSQFQANGIRLETVNTTGFVSNVSGGIRQRTTIVGDIDLLLTVDASRLTGWEDAGTFFVYGLGLYGNDPSQNVGDLQGVSAIAAPNTWKLFEAWYQLPLFDGRVSLLAGLYDVTSEFDVIRSSSELFLQSSFGTGAELALGGESGLSTFPTSSLGLRGQVNLTNEFTLRGAVMDGVVGDPDNLEGTHIILHEDDGLFLTMELAYYRFGDLELQERAQQPDRLLRRRLTRAAALQYDGKYAVGTWLFTREFNDLQKVDALGTPLTRDETFGIYGIAEQGVYHETHDPHEGLRIFARVGWADPRVNQVEWYLGGGFVYTGLIPTRNSDQTGFGVAAAVNGTNFKKSQRQANQPVSQSEIVLEFTHSFSVHPALNLQPDIQYVMNPGTDPSRSDALVIGGRLELYLDWFQ